MDKAKINSKLIVLTAMLVVALEFNACTCDDDSSSEKVDLFSCSGSNNKEIEYDYFEYYGKTYKTVEIGTQTWMTENLNYAVGRSVCYGDHVCGYMVRPCPDCEIAGNECYWDENRYYVRVTSNCNKYGKLYNWLTAMALDTNWITADTSCEKNSCADQIAAKHRGICPSGWHIPSRAEWNTLLSYVESDQKCSGCAAKHLKSSCGWIDGGNGLDTYGFAALPSGGGGGPFGAKSVGYYGYWWSSTEYDDKTTYLSFMFYGSDAVHWDDNYRQNELFSVRCVKD